MRVLAFPSPSTTGIRLICSPKMTFRWTSQSFRRRLQRANLILGLLHETVPAFTASQLPPVAFISFDVDTYSSTVQALKLLEAPHSMLLPRIHCFFDDILGFTHGDFTGERLAISEFNQTHQMRKISPLYGLKYYVNPESANQRWVECFWIAHFFDHELYKRNDGLIRTSRIGPEGINLLAVPEREGFTMPLGLWIPPRLYSERQIS